MVLASDPGQVFCISVRNRSSASCSSFGSVEVKSQWCARYCNRIGKNQAFLLGAQSAFKCLKLLFHVVFCTAQSQVRLVSSELNCLVLQQHCSAWLQLSGWCNSGFASSFGCAAGGTLPWDTVPSQPGKICCIPWCWRGEGAAAAGVPSKKTWFSNPPKSRQLKRSLKLFYVY